jgi:DNA repair protein RAD5
MVSKERVDRLDTTGLSPLWTELRPENQKAFYYNSYSGQVSLIRPSEDHCRGGILADDMGLGLVVVM